MTQYSQQEISQEKAKDTVLKQANTLEGWPVIQGYNFETEFAIESFLQSFLRTGFQATQLGKAIEIVKEMQKQNATIFFGFTSNMGTCGIREIITYLVKQKKVHVLGTTVGAIEEDIIKCFRPFVLGDFHANGTFLRDEGINRTGNIFIPNDRYLHFERFMNPFFERLFNLQKETGKIIGIKEFVYELGHELELQNVDNKEQSFTYWAYKNNLPFFCPALLDGSLGDMLYFYKKKFRDFKIDTSEYILQVTDLALNCEKMAMICIGGSVPKHMFANAGLFRDGCDFTVYINTGLEAEGSNAGASIDEAVSWGKISANAERIKVELEASVAFPILVLGGFKLFNK